MLNASGGIECDFTVTRLAEERFRIVTGTAFGRHDLAWIRSHAPEDGAVSWTDVTSRYACLGLWGPAAREILQPLDDAELSNDAFPYMRARELTVGPVPCLACASPTSASSAGSSTVRSSSALRLWDALMDAGREHGLVAGGYSAIDSLRLEKGYRVWGADISPDDTPWEAGLGFAVKLDKGEFVGREALEAAPEPERRLVCLVARGSALGRARLGAGPDRRRDRGRVTSGGFGYTVERSIAYAYVPAESARRRAPRSRWRSSASGSGGEVAEEPLFDPHGERIRA